LRNALRNAAAAQVDGGIDIGKSFFVLDGCLTGKETKTPGVLRGRAERQGIGLATEANLK